VNEQVGIVGHRELIVGLVVKDEAGQGIKGAASPTDKQ
jgi:hypothetical protein